MGQGFSWNRLNQRAQLVQLGGPRPIKLEILGTSHKHYYMAHKIYVDPNNAMQNKEVPS